MLKFKEDGVNRLKLGYFIVELVVGFQCTLLILFELGLIFLQTADVVL